MRIVIFGCTQYSLKLVKAIANKGYSIAGLVTTPDSFNISYSKAPIKVCNYADLKTYGSKNKIPVVMVKKSLSDYHKEIKKLEPDVIFVLGWYHNISKKILNIPKKGCLGIHASILPDYAGGAPLVWAIIKGEEKAGVTLFYLADSIDSGDIVAQREIAILEKDDITSVYKKAEKASIGLLLEFLPLIKTGQIPRLRQDKNRIKYYPQRKPEDGRISWERSAQEIYNFVRAQTRPYPGAFCFLGKEKIVVWKAHPVKYENEKTKIGEVVMSEPNQFKVKAKKDALLVTAFDCKSGIKKGDIIK